MISAFLIGLTFGLIGKYIIEGNESGHFITPLLVSLFGAYLPYFFGQENHYLIEDPNRGFIYQSFGSIIFLCGYYFFRKGLLKGNHIHHDAG